MIVPSVKINPTMQLLDSALLPCYSWFTYFIWVYISNFPNETLKRFVKETEFWYFNRCSFAGHRPLCLSEYRIRAIAFGNPLDRHGYLANAPLTQVFVSIGENYFKRFQKVKYLTCGWKVIQILVFLLVPIGTPKPILKHIHTYSKSVQLRDQWRTVTPIPLDLSFRNGSQKLVFEDIILF